MSTQLSIAETLTMLEECFVSEPGSLREDMSRDNIGGWDSMGALMLMSELDSRFNLLLTPEQSRTMRSIQDVIEYLRAEGRLKS